MSPDDKQGNGNGGDAEEVFAALLKQQPTKRDQQIEELQEKLTAEQDARKEERFIFIVLIVILLDIVFFTVMPSFGGPLALLILQLLVFIPLARRMGMQEFAQIVNSVLDRVAGKRSDAE